MSQIREICVKPFRHSGRYNPAIIWDGLELIPYLSLFTKASDHKQGTKYVYEINVMLRNVTMSNGGMEFYLVPADTKEAKIVERVLDNIMMPGFKDSEWVDGDIDD